MDEFFAFLFVAALVWLFIAIVRSRAERPAPEIECPHCKVTGKVTVTDVMRPRGLSGGKATGALFTGGASMLFTGLSRYQNVRELNCENCSMKWDVA